MGLTRLGFNRNHEPQFHDSNSYSFKIWTKNNLIHIQFQKQKQLLRFREGDDVNDVDDDDKVDEENDLII